MYTRFGASKAQSALSLGVCTGRFLRISDVRADCSEGRLSAHPVKNLQLRPMKQNRKEDHLAKDRYHEGSFSEGSARSRCSRVVRLTFVCELLNAICPSRHTRPHRLGLVMALTGILHRTSVDTWSWPAVAKTTRKVLWMNFSATVGPATSDRKQAVLDVWFHQFSVPGAPLMRPRRFGVTQPP